MNKVILTGANGFIGSHISSYFSEKNVDLTCFIRKSSKLDYIKDLNIKLAYGDLRDYNSLKKAFKGKDFVIHTGAYVKDWGAYENFYNINILGTLNVLKAGLENGIKDFIIMSSCSVYGEENFYELKDEKDPLNSHYKYFLDKIFPCKMNYYRDSKKIAKLEAIKFAKEHKLNLTFIEPVWVYGEYEFNTGFYEYLKTNKAIPFSIGSKKNKFHIIYAGDLARAFYLSYEKRLEGINSFLIGNEKSEFMYKIFDKFSEKAGLKKTIRIKKYLIYPLGFLIELFYTILKIKTPPLLTRGRINMFYDNIEYSTKKAEKILNFKNKYNLDQGIEKTVQWYKKNNLI